MNDPDIDPCQKCKTCGHSRWQNDEELIVAVATGVMGWQSKFAEWPPNDDGSLDGFQAWHNGSDVVIGVADWDPLADDSDACDVLDRIANQDSQVLLHWTGTSWHVQFEKTDLWFSHEYHTDRRRAIVLSALNAVVPSACQKDGCECKQFKA